MFATHDSLPLHGSMSSHEFGLIEHENKQLFSHPVPGPLFALPKSHCSPASVAALPHTPLVHAPLLHV